MQVAKAILLTTFILTACQKREPDFKFIVVAPSGESSVGVSGFQPRGTIEGTMLLTFRSGSASAPNVATLLEVRNGVMGWVSDHEFALVADHLRYAHIASDYYPDGTVRTRIRLIACARDETNCSSLADRIANTSAKHVPQFPESS